MTHAAPSLQGSQVPSTSIVYKAAGRQVPVQGTVDTFMTEEFDRVLKNMSEPVTVYQYLLIIEKV